MDITRLAVQVVVAIVCAGLATILVPRRIPGRLVGLVLLGLIGVWVGEWGFALMRARFGLNFAFLAWNIEGVLIVPAIIGSAIVLYLVTLFLKLGHFD